MINPTSPLLQARIAQQQNNSVNQQPKQDLPKVEDSVELSTKPKMSKKKKALIAFTAALGAAAVAAGVVSLTRKGVIQDKTLVQAVQGTEQKIKTASQGILDDVQKIQDTLNAAQKRVDEVLSSFTEVKPLEDGTKVIEKFADDGKTLVSKSTLRNDFLTIDDFAEKTRINANNGKLRNFYKGAEFSGDYIKRADECFEIFEGFYRNAEFVDGSAIKADEYFDFLGKEASKNNLYQYHKNVEFTPDNATKSDECFSFTDGKLFAWAKDYQKNFLADEFGGEKIFFDDDEKLIQWANNYQLSSDGKNWTYDSLINVENGKIKKYS